MQYNPLSILLTIAGLYVASFLLMALFTFVYLGFTKHSHEVKPLKVFLAIATLAFFWILATFVSIFMSVSFGLVALVILSAILIFSFANFVSAKILLIKGRSQFIYCLILAVIFNPGWFSLFKVL